MINNVLWALGSAYLLWILYVFTMGIYRAYLDKRMNKWNFVLAAPFVLLAGIVDVGFNAIVATVLCLEPPREWLFTQRLQRYLRDYPSSGGLNGWRYRFARGICTKILDMFDPTGSHCDS